ncbi:hypothetical protein ACA910_020665 [Epithemia clementina (nom. ined.)]
MTLKEFYLESHRAPYLQKKPVEDIREKRPAAESEPKVTLRTSSQSNLGKNEADTAAGGVTHVGSFLNMHQSVQSDHTLRYNSRVSTSSLGGMAGGNAAGVENVMSDHQHVAGLQQGNLRATSHDDESRNLGDASDQIKPDWRLRDRMRTVGVGLVMALNPGTDPPDVTKPHPCAVLQCWTDPRTISRSAAKGLIVERLEQQYAKWQLARTGKPLKYRKALDPTVDDVRDLCIQLRRQARNERLLLHYNGHGVPRPTANGEVWVFDKKHREYIPLAVADLRNWLGVPSIVVLDCSNSGILIQFWKDPLSDSPPPSPPLQPDGTIDMEEQSSIWVRDTIVLCACSENEWIPMNPEYPADVFTCCLTTPIKISLLWFVLRNQSMSNLDLKALDLIPGKANDRKTPLGELNWIFTAVTDSIAWNVLPKPLFHRLFRQDLLVASMFRNFLLADRILRSLGCTPVSHPPLPSGIAQHPLWEAWDLACETMLVQLKSDGLLDSNGNRSADATAQSDDGERPGSEPASPRLAVQQTSVSSPFFSEQLTAFEVWLSFAEIHKMRLKRGELQPPEQLPIVLQVLLSPVLRVRALELLRRFLDLGHWAVNLSLSLGIFPYVMKMLQSPEYKSLLVSIWASILCFDPSCRVDLLREGAFHHFVQHLVWGLNGPVMEVAEAAKERTLAAFVLAAACHDYAAGQTECARLNLHGNCCALLSSYESAEQGESLQDDAADLHLPAHFRSWLCICIANMTKDNVQTQNEAYSSGVHTHLFARLNDRNAEVRAAVCYALGCLVGFKPNPESNASSNQDLQSLAPSVQSATPGGINQQPLTQFSPGSLMMQSGTSASGLPNASLQPQFSNPTGIPNLNWNAQGMTGRPIQFQQGQQLPLQFAQQSGQVIGQSMQIPQTIMQSQFMVHGQSVNNLQMQQPVGSPASFLMGPNPMTSHNQPLLQTAAFQQRPQIETRQMQPTVFEDHQRLSMDCQVMEQLASMATDASVVVRYECVVGLAQAVAKYLDAFVVVAYSSSGVSSVGRDMNIPMPRGLERRSLERFRTIWKVIRSVQHEDPFPTVTQAANDIVSVVHEVVLKYKLKIDIEPLGTEKPDGFQTKKSTNILVGIDEDGHDGTNLRRPVQQIKFGFHQKDENELRRVASEVVTGHSSLEQAAKHLSAPTLHLTETNTNYSLPESSFYHWKKSSFDVNFRSTETEDHNLDPLSPRGAARSYREARDKAIRLRSAELARHFSPLIPKPPKPTRKHVEIVFEEEEDVEVAEEMAKRKQELQFREQTLLRTDLTHTSNLNFHSLEDYVMACCEGNRILMWQTNTGEKVVEFSNGNTKSTRMTTSSWINEESSSLFLVGCDDGTVRLWGNLIGCPGGPKPSLVSSFHALKKTSGQIRKSGIVCEWQNFSGFLLAGGNSPIITCWDLEAEKQVAEIPTEAGTEVCVTTLTTAWDYDSLGLGPSPNKGIGRDVFVAGMSNGTLKIFDLRSHLTVKRAEAKKSRRSRLQTYSEHKSWVVATSFTGYGGQYELVSGTTEGTIKVWDLRMMSSFRTIEAQRSVMTAMAVHPQVPIVATGSGTQFVKILTRDGETLQVIRNHRIGPVSCLAFHKYKPLMATGATDSFIGLYKLAGY